MNIKTGLIALCLCLTGLSVTPFTTRAADTPATQPGEIDAKAAFAKLKTLAGSWQSSQTNPMAEFKVLGGGYVVIETILPGTSEEIVNAYHLDGDRLLVTHFGADGNQPRLKLVSIDGSQFLFDLESVTNLNGPNDHPVDHFVLDLKSANELSEHWDYHARGKIFSRIGLELTRSIKR